MTRFSTARLSRFALLVLFSLLTQARAEAQLTDLLGQGGGLGGAAGFDPEAIDIQATLVTSELKAGGTAVFAITATLPPTFYIYSMNPSFGGKTVIRLKNAGGLIPIDAGLRPDRNPKVVDDPVLNQTVEKFYSEVTWFQRFRIPEGVDPATLKISGEMEGQYCSEDPANGKCIPIRPPFEFTAGLKVGEPPEVIVPVLAQLDEIGKPNEASAKNAASYQLTARPETRSGDAGPVEWTVQLTPADAGPGEEVTLELTARLDPGFHIFALTQDPEMAGQPTRIDVKVSGMRAVTTDFVPSTIPEIVKPLDDITQEVHHEEVTWSQVFVVNGNSSRGGYRVTGSVSFQTCDETRCLPESTLEFRVGASPPRGIPSVQGPVAIRPPDVDQVPGPAPSPDDAVSAEGKIKQGGLGAFLLVAILSGFAALLTPCVFPMVPITVSLFLKQSEREHHRPVMTATVYCLGIIVSFTVLGLLMAAVFGATSINELANNAWLNLMIAGVLVFFGANLLGLFEIRVPSFLLTWSAGREGQGGILGVLFMALTFTLVSFTCTFAFAGGLLVVAARGDYLWPILGMLAFSTAFATPFFFLALFPSMLQKLPKSGGWMNTIKVSMGMIEIGAALKFLSVADLSWNPQPVIFDYSFTMAAWMMLAASLGLYLLGMFRLSHDSSPGNISVPRFGFAMFFLTFAAYLAVGVFGREEPRGFVWEQIRVFAPPVLEGGEEKDLGPYVEHEGMKFALDYEQAREFAAASNIPLFLDFTGVNCVNCRLMEKRMGEPQNKSLLENFIRVQLYTDNVPHITDESLVERLLDKNRKMQEDWFSDVTLPAYAVVTPDGETLLATFKGLETEDGQFAQFLKDGLKRWDSQSRTTAQANPASSRR